MSSTYQNYMKHQEEWIKTKNIREEHALWIKGGCTDPKTRKQIWTSNYLMVSLYIGVPLHHKCITSEHMLELIWKQEPSPRACLTFPQTPYMHRYENICIQQTWKTMRVIEREGRRKIKKKKEDGYL
jgi:hypothetical protein